MKRSITVSLITRVCKIGILLVTIGSLIGLGFFLYTNFYQPLTDAPNIVLLRASVTSASINTAAMNAALKFIRDTSVASTTPALNLFTVGQPPVVTPLPANTPPPPIPQPQPKT